MQLSPSYIFSHYQKFICPRCEFLLNSTAHIPIVAPCGHTFCSICIEEEFLEKNKFRCDLCKSETSEHFSLFPINLYILNIRKNKMKNENIFVGGKSPVMINRSLKLVRSNTSKSTLELPFGKSKAKNLETFYKIVNVITYKFFENKIDIIEREVNLDNINDIGKNDCPSDFSNKKNSSRFRKFVSNYLDDNAIKYNKTNINIFEDDLKQEIPKKIEIIDFYGDGGVKKNKYPPLYNYTELLKKIFKYQDKYVKKYFNAIIIFFIRTFTFFGMLILNIYLIKYIDLAFFFLFVNILLEKEDTIYQISTKIKMFIALSCFYFVERIVKNLGFKYLIDMSSYISNISSGTRTLFNLLVLGSDSTLNLVVFIILNILSNLHLLLN